MIYRLLAAGAIAAAIALGGYFYGKSKVTALWEADKAVWQANFDKQKDETDRVQGEWNKAKETANAIQDKLDTATADSDSLAGKLRDYQARARRCAMPNPAGSPGSPDAASGVAADSDGVEQALGEHLAACARDAERLTQFQVFYESLRQAQ